ncbi:ABC-type spermidine/putrescine transport system permease subunit II [Rhodobacter viridis]|uniref:ABC-type spermidine/putrescine transport system permease subunit II n=1 Tax=Rhodobacter viridis TaxID=1054202 RepID=A0A318TTR3_9RHOB|nr:ABC transporter permease [Rhodobacter viridis]PYF08172.1 ABC-type spermidine/putrescine transport system permease subunit II [Rhodobacter viridis]
MKRSFLTLFALGFFAFLYVPLFVIIGYSFNANPVNMLIWDGFTLDWYRGLLGLGTPGLDAQNRGIYIESTPQLLAALKTSLIVACSTTVISTIFGTSLALALARFQFRAKPLYTGGLMLPIMMPDIVLGIGLLIFFSTIGLRLSILTIVLGQCTFLTSYVCITVQARLAGLDPALEEASADLGANAWTTFRKVTLPQLAPGLVGGALLAFIISMDDLVITYFISGTGSQTLPIYIFGMIRRGVKPEINAIATLIILASMLVAALGLWLRARQDRS